MKIDIYIKPSQKDISPNILQDIIDFITDENDLKEIQEILKENNVIFE